MVTDPPYNLGYKGRGNLNKFEGFANDKISMEEHSKFMDSVFSELFRVLKQDTAIYVYIDFRNYARFYSLIEKYFVIKNCIVWVKNNFGLGKHYRFQHEFLIYATKGDFKLPHNNISDVWDIRRLPVHNYKHPTEKPLMCMKKPILHASRPDNLILDPFMGSWTTAQAARETERNFIGSELDSNYCQIGERRLKTVQRNLF